MILPEENPSLGLNSSLSCITNVPFFFSKAILRVFNKKRYPPSEDTFSKPKLNIKNSTKSSYYQKMVEITKKILKV